MNARACHNRSGTGSPKHGGRGPERRADGMRHRPHTEHERSHDRSHDRSNERAHEGAGEPLVGASAEPIQRSNSSPGLMQSVPDSRHYFLSYFASQLGWEADEPPEHAHAHDLQRRREGIYNFFHVPWNLERLLLFGYLACFDSFVQQFTFLPLRICWGAATLLRWRRPTAAQKRDMLRGTLICFVTFLLLRIDVSQTYHNVRNQSTMKLYVVFNILEILDKLCASFGEDILASLYSSVSSRRKKRPRGGAVLDFVIALVYIVLHTLVLFYQSVAFNVAVNSQGNMLLTLLVSNNFTELKACVFKRCESENLFQICCADTIERFQLSMYLVVVSIQKIVQTREWTTDKALDFGTALLFVALCEVVIDWVKHAFVTKFNRIRPDVYAKFLHILSDMTLQLQRPGAAMGNEAVYAVTARMGFVPIPLLCLLVRVVANDIWPSLDFRHASTWLLCLLCWVVCCAFKVLINLLLLGSASVRVERANLEASMTGAERPGSHEFKLDGVGRYTLYGKQVV